MPSHPLTLSPTTMESMDIIKADNRGRITLGKHIAEPGQNYRVYTDDEGHIILTPILVVDETALSPETRAAITHELA